MKKIISSSLILIMVMSMVVFSLPKTTKAANNTLYISSPQYASTSPNQSTEVTMYWTIGTQRGGSTYVVSSSSKVYIKIKSATTSALVLASTTACTTGTTTFGSLIGYYGNYGYGTSTYTLATSTPQGGTATTCIKLPNGLGAGVYYLSVYSEGTAYDALAATLYVGTSNQVTVSADIEPTIGFTLSANSCDLGVLTTAAPSTCTYSATTSANFTSGGSLVVKVASNNTSLQEPTGGVISGVGGSCTAITGGTNGIRVLSTSTADWLSTDGFNCAAGSGRQVAVIGPSPDTLLTSGTWTNGDGAFTVQHIAQASNTSNVGHYTQQITYMVTVSF